VDGAKKSPFRHWRHHHLFEADVCDGENGTIMTDRVEYALPFGVIGLLLDLTVMRVVFTAMFLARHRATKKFFTKGKTSRG
jgi:ligand-binding SRPBCC domain-containing protein